VTYTEYTPGQPAAVPPQPEQKKGLKKALAIGAPIAVAGLVGAASLTGVFGAGDPEIGDCVHQNGNSWDVVDCGSGEAQYKVVGVEDDQQSYNDFQADPDTCLAFPQAEYFMWIGPEGGLGTVYCSEPV
jgi:hypothetical protein